MNAAYAGQKSLPLIDAGTHLSEKNRSDRYRTLVSIALKNSLDIKKIKIDGVERFSIYVPPLLGVKVAAVADKHDMSFHEAWASLTQAGINHLQGDVKKLASIADKVKPVIDEFSIEQSKMYAAISAGLSQNKVVLSEASTGIGKSWVMCASALKEAEAKKTPVVITAPTLSVLGQLWAEMIVVKGKMIEQGSLKKIPSIAFFPGATEFIDDIKLKAYIEENNSLPDEDRDLKVEGWISNGGKPLSLAHQKKANPLVEAMQSMGTDVAWLADDLRRLAVNLSPDDFRLKSGVECESTINLKAVRENARDADIIFCTHAMLAYSQKSKWALVPAPLVIMVDEAHQLESNFANIYSDSMSLRMFRYRLSKFAASDSRGKTVAKKAVSTISAIMKELRDLEPGDGKERVSVVDEKLGGSKSHLLNMLGDLEQATRSKLLNGLDLIADNRLVIKNMQSILNHQSSDKGYIEFSPDRRFPSMMVGRSDIRAVLGSLWKNAEGGSLLMSATIFINDKFGNQTSDYFCSNTAIPSSKAHITPPIIAPWVTGTPVLHTPSKEKAIKLSRPRSINGSVNERDENAWFENLSGEINAVAKQAEGGTLVLATSYVQVESIGKRLALLGIDESRIIRHKRNEKFITFEQQFRDAHKQGLRPVFISLGAAWTGVNLRDESIAPSKDTLLTDLVVACCPVGLNRSCTMLSKIERTGTYPIEKEALMLLKQGIGRLMRHRLQKHRNIWIMDGRIWATWRGMGNFQLSVQRMLEKYKTKKEF